MDSVWGSEEMLGRTDNPLRLIRLIWLLVGSGIASVAVARVTKGTASSPLLGLSLLGGLLLVASAAAGCAFSLQKRNDALQRSRADRNGDRFGTSAPRMTGSNKRFFWYGAAATFAIALLFFSL